MDIKTHMAEMVRLCQKIKIIGTNDTIKVKNKEYYATFKFREMVDKECPKCKGEGTIPL